MTSDAIRILEATQNFGSVHGVPAENIERMAARWESMPQHLQSSTFYAH